MPLRNVRPGTALLRGIGLTFARPVPGGGVPTLAVVPPGERTRVQFTVPKYEGEESPTLTEFQQHGGFALEVSYTDVSGGQWTLTRAHVGRDAQRDRWYVSQIHLFHKVGEQNGSVDWGEPVASSSGAFGL